MIPLVFVGIRLIFVEVGVRGWRSRGSFEWRAAAGATAVVTDIRYGTVRSGTDGSTVAVSLVCFLLPDNRTAEAKAMVVEHPGSK